MKPFTLATLAGALAASTMIGAAPASASTAPACVWHQLSLTGGWQSDSSVYGTADPMYCIANGYVYLAGGLSNPASQAVNFAMLPPQALPSHPMFRASYTYGGTYGYVGIDVSGELDAEGPDLGNVNALKFTSLDGISFPLSSTAQTPLSLINGWQPTPSGGASYSYSGGIVHLDGAVTHPSANPGSIFASIPGQEADGCITAPVFTDLGPTGSQVGDLSVVQDITPFHDYSYLSVTDEQVTGSAAQYASLAGVTYPLAGAAWQPVSLSPNWAVWGGGCSNNPAYDINAGIVYLRGTVRQVSPGCTLAVLPAAARPQTTLWFLLSGNGHTTGAMSIYPDGTMCVWSNGQASGGIAASLAGVSYHLSS